MKPLLAISVIILILVSCTSPTKSDLNQSVPGNIISAPIGITHYRMTIELTQAQPQRCLPNSPILITLEEVSLKQNPRVGYFKVENVEAKTIHYGWCKSGEYLHCSSDLGEQGVQVLKLKRKSARIAISYSRVEGVP